MVARSNKISPLTTRNNSPITSLAIEESSSFITTRQQQQQQQQQVPATTESSASREEEEATNQPPRDVTTQKQVVLEQQHYRKSPSIYERGALKKAVQQNSSNMFIPAGTEPTLHNYDQFPEATLDIMSMFQSLKALCADRYNRDSDEKESKLEYLSSLEEYLLEDDDDDEVKAAAIKEVFHEMMQTLSSSSGLAFHSYI